MIVPTEPVLTGDIRFIDRFTPGLRAGNYEIEATWELEVDGASPDALVQRITVDGPRFALPPGDVHAMFPPPGSSGEFDRVLPHVVLSERLLPWERACPPLSVGVPWLALLVLSPEEFVAVPGEDSVPTVATDFARTTTVGDLLSADPAAVCVPDLPGVSRDNPDPCDVITIASATFEAILATGHELPYLAHGRTVGTEAKPVLDLAHDGEFSVVVANRFPAVVEGEPTPSVVHLVSVEGFGSLLSGDRPTRPAQPAVRLISLAHWSFSTDAGDAQTFSGLAAGLATEPDGRLRPAEELMLRLPASPRGDASATDRPSAAVAERLADGYVAAGYHARTGEDGFAWYRGPFTPTVQQAPPTPLVGLRTADAAIVFDPETGVFDHRLAAAWQCGRNLALANQAFAEALMRMRRGARRALMQRVARTGGMSDAREALAQLFQAGALQRVGSATSAAPPAQAPWTRDGAAPASIGTQLQALLADDAAVEAALAELEASGDLTTIGRWLGSLLLLQGVPFDHLVPDDRMLPAESLRFFYVDGLWTSALLDGAMSIGVATAEDARVQAVLAPAQRAAAREAAWAARATEIGGPVPLIEDGPVAGIVLRSALVTGWPGFTVHGAVNQGTTPLPLLRLDVLSPGVAVALFAGVPDTVSLTAPHEGMAFGVDREGLRVLRDRRGLSTSLSVEVYRPGDPAFGTLRSGDHRVLNLRSRGTSEPPAQPRDLVPAIADRLDVPAAEFGPAAFALQMVRGPEQFTLRHAHADAGSRRP